MGKKILDRALVFGTGASFYSLLETIWRGHTHWSMSLTGGLVLLTVYTAERRTHLTLWRRCLRSAGIITACVAAVRLAAAPHGAAAAPSKRAVLAIGEMRLSFCGEM